MAEGDQRPDDATAGGGDVAREVGVGPVGGGGEAVGEDVEEVMATMEDMEATIWEVAEELLLHGKACTMMSLNLVASIALVVPAEALILNMRHQPTRPPAPRTLVSQGPTTAVVDEEGTAGSILTLDRDRDRVGP